MAIIAYQLLLEEVYYPILSIEDHSITKGFYSKFHYMWPLHGQPLVQFSFQDIYIYMYERGKIVGYSSFHILPRSYVVLLLFFWVQKKLAILKQVSNQLIVAIHHANDVL